MKLLCLVIVVGALGCTHTMHWRWSGESCLVVRPIDTPEEAYAVAKQRCPNGIRFFHYQKQTVFYKCL